ncbi:extracellular solute-binding protein [Paenibacillus mendelii]|uniref:Extracellular solute-binding protein n=1 Tax=Paenibacillus mendelii TaxID=206163 RepID=A0ABV6J365_9BACL|nr:extracellular solute-binding protein [Paenibacillus mendelii]MCQ6562816.1 extracellular solute-binding protein [Paenibacillus mendelii]
MRRENEFLYTKLYKTLKEQICNGHIQPGEYLLPENELSSHYGISRKSVRHALSLLQNDGLVIKRAGLGTMVPEELIIEKSEPQTLRILTPSPAFFVDRGLPVFMEAFKNKHPHIDIQVLGLPADKFWESFRSSNEMGLIADLVLVPDIKFSELSCSTDFVDIAPFVTDLTDTIYPKIMRHFRSDGKMLAAPFTFSSVFFACNPDLFEQQGIPVPINRWSFDEFVAAAERLTLAQDGMTTQFGFSMHPVANRWLSLAVMNGFTPGDTANHKHVLTHTLSVIQDLFFRKRIATTFPEMVWPRTPFIQGKSALVLTTTFEMANWQNEDMNFIPQVIPLPFDDGCATLLLANAFMVPATSQNVQLAVSFIRTALEDAAQRELTDKTLFLSVKEPINASAKKRSYLHSLNIANNQIDNNFFIDELFDDDIRNELEEEMSMFWLGLEPPASIVAACERLVLESEQK